MGLISDFGSFVGYLVSRFLVSVFFFFDAVFFVGLVLVLLGVSALCGVVLWGVLNTWVF